MTAIRVSPWRAARMALATAAAAMLAVPWSANSARARTDAQRPVVRRSPFADATADAARRIGLPAALLQALIEAESGGNPRAISPAGVLGLTQLMPATWAYERARLGLGDDPFEPRDNILAGADYLRAMRVRYGSIGMLAAYNAGPGRYEAYRRTGRPLPAETVAYVRRLAPIVAREAVIEDPSFAPRQRRGWAFAPLIAASSASHPWRSASADHAPSLANATPVRPHADARGSAFSPSSRSALYPQHESLFVALRGASS